MSLAHGLEWLQRTGGFDTVGSSTGHGINATIVPGDCRGPDLIASRVCDRLQGVSELVAIFGEDQIKRWPLSPRLHPIDNPRPAIMVYLVGVEPNAEPTEASRDETEVFIGIVWRQSSLLPLPLYAPGPGTLSTLIRAVLYDDPNLSVTVNGQSIQLAQKTRAGRESLYPLAISQDDTVILHELSQVYTVKTSRPTGQVFSVVQAL